jgi:catechol-2,3-dioxygenase
VVEVNHEFCVSIYTTDPDGNTVEFCHDLREFTPEEKSRAHELLADPSPAMDKDATITLWPPTGEPVRV